MTRRMVACLLGSFFCASAYSTAVQPEEKHIVIIMVTHNAQSYIEKSIESVLNQNYSNYILLIIDDCSKDGTVEFVKKFACDKGQEHQIACHKNKIQRNNLLINYLRAAKVSNDDDILVILSPQDFFAHNEVLSYLNNLYQSNEVWMTYGPMREYPSYKRIHDHKIPEEVVEFNAYKDYLLIPTYLQSFYAALFKRIPIEQLSWKGKFIAMNNDLPALLPILERAGRQAYYVPDILSMYNTQLEHHRFIVNPEDQEAMEIMVRGRPKCEPLSCLGY